MTASAAVDPPFARIGIVGVGLIGGSIAKAVRAVWPAVQIIGLDGPEEIAEALEAGAITAGAPWSEEQYAALREADLIVIATPIPYIASQIWLAADNGFTGVVIDVGSTKREAIEHAEAQQFRRFVGTHPMAGAERGGLAHARADLFKGRPWILVRTQQTPADDFALVERFVRALGAQPREMDADAHDRAMAFVSHLPQILAVGLINAAGRAGGAEMLDVAGPAFREMTRLAVSPPDLWHGIVSANADYIEEAIEALALCLPRDAVSLMTREWISEAFAESREWRERLESGPRQS